MAIVLLLIRLLILVQFAWVATACDRNEMPPPAPAPAPEVRDVTGETEIEMEADNFYFEPRYLRGRSGQRLILKIRNESGTLHNFSISEQQIDRDIPPRREVEIEVTFPQSGAIDFVCKYHVEQGMIGQLLVGEAMPADAATRTTPTPNPES